MPFIEPQLPISDQSRRESPLARGVEPAFRTGGHDVAELRAAVTAYVAGAKGRQAPPQEVIAFLKAELHRASAPDVEYRDFNTLTARVVRWSIEEYYREP